MTDLIKETRSVMIMASKSELLALADRVESGSGRDAPLSYAIAKAIEPVGDPPDLLTSVDATEALREKLLPATEIVVSCDISTSDWRATIWTDNAFFISLAKSEPRARLAAILRALAGAPGGKEGP